MRQEHPAPYGRVVAALDGAKAAGLEVLQPSLLHSLARDSRGPRWGRTTQKRWPVGASITHQRLMNSTRFAPSAVWRDVGGNLALETGHHDSVDSASDLPRHAS